MKTAQLWIDDKLDVGRIVYSNGAVEYFDMESYVEFFANGPSPMLTGWCSSAYSRPTLKAAISALKDSGHVKLGDI